MMPCSKLLLFSWLLFGILVSIQGLWRLKRLPYCPTASFLKSIMKGRGVPGGRGKRSVTWPYNCVHASILQYQGMRQFIQPIYTCCTSCDPEFKKCLSKHSSYSGSLYICPSDGFQCIVTCVKKHDPNASQSGGGGGGGWFGRRTRTRRYSRRLGRKTRYRKVNSKCQKRSSSKGKPCIQRLCIPLQNKIKGSFLKQLYKQG